MSHVGIKKSLRSLWLVLSYSLYFTTAPCHMAIHSCHIANYVCVFFMSIGVLSFVDFMKWPCRLVKFKGQGPLNVWS